MEQSNQWRYKISIKDQFEDESTLELIKELCGKLTNQLKTIRNKIIEISKSKIDDDERYYFTDKLDECIDNFEWLSTQDGAVYDLERDFNGYLEELYDISDSRIIIGNVSYKFIWIG